MRENNNTILMVIVVSVIALSAGVWFGFDTRPPQNTSDEGQIHGMLLNEAKQISDFKLLDNHSKSFTVQNLTNRWSVVFFGYTHCPDVCPTTLNTLKYMVELLKKQQIESPQVVFVSIDPERDTPVILDKYITYFNKDFVGVTGEKKELEKLTGALGIYYKKTPGSSGDINADDYLMDHSASFIFIDPEAKVKAVFSSPQEAAILAKDIQTVMKLAAGS